MIIQRINEGVDVILQGEVDINTLTPMELVDQIETENRLYYYERMKRKQQRRLRNNINVFRRALNLVIGWDYNKYIILLLYYLE